MRVRVDDSEFGDRRALNLHAGANVTITALADSEELDVVIGSASAGGVGGYRHVQSTPASVWSVAHNLGRKPGGITPYDSGGTQLHGVVAHVDINNLTITYYSNGLPVAEAGEAEIS